MYKKTSEIRKAIALSFLVGSSTAYAGSISPKSADYYIGSGSNISVDLISQSGEGFWYLKDVNDYFNHQGVLTIENSFLNTLSAGQHSFELYFSDSSKEKLTINVLAEETGGLPVLLPKVATFDIKDMQSPSFKLELNGDTLQNISLAGHDVTYENSNNSIEFNSDYLKSLGKGTHVFSLQFIDSNDLTISIDIVDTTIDEDPNLPVGEFHLNASDAQLYAGAELQSDYASLAQGLIEWNYFTDKAGRYEISFVYQSPHGEKSNQFYVNDTIETVSTQQSTLDTAHKMIVDLAVGDNKVGVDGRGQWGYIWLRGVNIVSLDTDLPSHDPSLMPSMLTFDINSDDTANFTLNSDGASIDTVKLENILLASNEYLINGTILTLNRDYLSQLNDGNYLLNISFTDAEAVSATLKVATSNTTEPSLFPASRVFNTLSPTDTNFMLELAGQEILSKSIIGTSINPMVNGDDVTISKADLLTLQDGSYTLAIHLKSGETLSADIMVTTPIVQPDPTLPANADTYVSNSVEQDFREYINTINGVQAANFIDMDTLEYDWNGQNMYGDELYGREIGENVGIIWAGWGPSHYTGANYDYKMGMIDANNIKRVSFIPTYFIDTYAKGVVVGNDQLTLNKDQQATILTELFSRGVRLNYRAHIDPMRFAYGESFDANGPGAKYWRGLFHEFDPMNLSQNYKAVMDEGLYVVAKAIRNAKLQGHTLKEPVRFDLGAELMESSKNYAHSWVALVSYVRDEIATKYSDVADDIILSHNFSHHVQYLMELENHESQFRRIISGGEAMADNSLYGEFDELLFIDDMNGTERNNFADYLRALDAVTVSQYMPLDNDKFTALERDNVNIDVTATDVKEALQTHEQNFIQKVMMGKLGLKYSELPQFHLGEYGMGLRGLYTPNIWNADDWQQDEMLTFDAQQKHAKVAIDGLMDYMNDPATMAKSLQIWISGAPYDVLRFYQNDGGGMHVGDESHGIDGCSPYNPFAAKALWDYWGGQAYGQTMTSDNRCEIEDADHDGYSFAEEITAGSDPYDINSTPSGNENSHAVLSNSDADINTKNLYSALVALPTQATNNVLSGQFGGYSGIGRNDLGRYNGAGEFPTDKYGAQYAANEMVKYDEAGMERPVIYACDFGMGWNPYESGNADSLTLGGVEINGIVKGAAMNYSCTDDLITKAGQGHVIQISNHLPNPTFDGVDNYKTVINNVTYAKILQAGTQERQNWLAIMDVVADGLQALEDQGVSVIYRPLHEMNGDWFWWGANDSNGGSAERQALYQSLYQDMHHYFTDIKGLDNLIWVWSPDASRNNMTGYYPGDDYVDVVGLDAYTASYLTIDAIVEDYNTLTNAFPSKPFALAEVGPKANQSNDDSAGVYGMWTPQTPLDYALLLDTIKSEMPKVVYFAAWNLGYSPSYKTTDNTFPNNGPAAFQKQNLATLGEFMVDTGSGGDTDTGDDTSAGGDTGIGDDIGTPVPPLSTTVLAINDAASSSVTVQPVTIEADYIQIENSQVGSSAGWDFTIETDGQYTIVLNVDNSNGDARVNEAFLDGMVKNFTASGPMNVVFEAQLSAGSHTAGIRVSDINAHWGYVKLLSASIEHNGSLSITAPISGSQLASGQNIEIYFDKLGNGGLTFTVNGGTSDVYYGESPLVVPVGEDGFYRITLGLEGSSVKETLGVRIGEQQLGSFVTTNGSQFELDGKPWYFNGSNQYYLMFKPEAMAEDFFNRAEKVGLNAVRTWMFCNDEGTHDGACINMKSGDSFILSKAANERTAAEQAIIDRSFEIFDNYVALAGAKNMRLILSLSDEWDYFGKIADYGEYGNVEGRNKLKAFMTNLLNHTNNITGIAYKDDPTIMMWELSNEARVKAGFTEWVDDIATHLSVLAPNQLLSIGMESSFDKNGSGDSYAVLKSLNSNEHIDAISAHIYPTWWNMSDEQTINNFELLAQLGRELDKPTYIGEFSWPANVKRPESAPEGNAYEDATIAEGLAKRSEVFADWYATAWLNKDAIGGMLSWQLSGLEWGNGTTGGQWGSGPYGEFSGGWSANNDGFQFYCVIDESEYAITGLGAPGNNVEGATIHLDLHKPVCDIIAQYSADYRGLFESTQ